MSAKRTEYVNGRYAKIRYECIQLLGGKCARCGFSDIRALHIDHIDGGGLKEKRKLGRNYMFKILKFLKANPNQTKYQCLCANCNWIKRDENGE